MGLAARSLLVGVFAGILLAFFARELLPLQTPPTASVPDAYPFYRLVDMLRNSLQRATRAVYKSPRPAAPSLLHNTHPHPSTTPSSSFSSTATMATQKSFLQAMQDRRTFYALNKDAPISDDRIVDLAKKAVLHVPSSFNSQSARLVVLLNAEHDKFWGYAKDVLKPMVPPEGWSATETRVNGHLGSYGTILFFEDPDPVHALQKAFPLYAHHFPTWSEHTSAMHQYALWVALEAEGFGANLQHYNPIVDRKTQDEWKVPQDWALRAQLVFGGKVGDGGAKEKEFKPLEDRVFVHGAK